MSYRNSDPIYSILYEGQIGVAGRIFNVPKLLKRGQMVMGKRVGEVQVRNSGRGTSEI